MKEYTLEQVLSSEIERVAKEKERNLDNIQKLKVRAAVAVGNEKARLEALVVLHQGQKVVLDNITPEVIEQRAQERFEKLSSRQPKPSNDN